MGKSHRLPSHTSTFVYSPLELIFTDLWGPSHITSYFGYKYYVSFIDAFSMYTWIYSIKSKAETMSIFQTFKSMVELPLNLKIKVSSLIREVNTNPFPYFYPLLAFLTKLPVLTLIIIMVWLRENIDI